MMMMMIIMMKIVREIRLEVLVVVDSSLRGKNRFYLYVKSFLKINEWEIILDDLIELIISFYWFYYMYL